MAKQRKRPRSSPSCQKKNIKIKSKRGKIVAEFVGHTGPGCPPRKKPSTRHLGPYKKNFGLQAKACAGSKRSAFISCMRRIKGTERAPRGVF